MVLGLGVTGSVQSNICWYLVVLGQYRAALDGTWTMTGWCWVRKGQYWLVLGGTGLVQASISQMVLGHGGAGSVKGIIIYLFFSSNFSGLVFWATCEKLLPAFSIPFNGPHRAVSLWSEEQISSSRGLVQKEISPQKRGGICPTTQKIPPHSSKNVLSSKQIFDKHLVVVMIVPCCHNLCISFSFSLISCIEPSPNNAMGAKENRLTAQLKLRQKSKLFRVVSTKMLGLWKCI